MGNVFGGKKSEKTPDVDNQVPTPEEEAENHYASSSNPKYITDRILFQMQVVSTEPIEGQKPGTSGLRKKVKVFEQHHYLENFIQSIFDVNKASIQGGTLVLGGDGRYYSDVAGKTIVRMAAANGVSKVFVGTNWLLGTPACACEITKRKSAGGILLTASHNPGGPDDDFGVKFNGPTGGPAQETVMKAIAERTKVIDCFRIADLDMDSVNFSQAGEYTFGDFSLEIFDGTVNYTEMMRSIFDFEKLRNLLSRPDFTMTFDALHGVAGTYAQKIFHHELGVPSQYLLNCVPSPNFGGGHPDPNLTYAKDLVKIMGLGDAVAGPIPTFGAACDGDMDRNMILGTRTFVTPSDSVAIIAANSQAIPYFQTNPLKGVARSMPTSRALDLVARKAGIASYEVPTGWKFFGNLISDGRIGLCGEESFGTGSSHVLEKDGIWAVMAWLQILAHKTEEAGKLVGVRDILEDHWRTYGRNYYTRYDFENVSSESGNQMMELLRGKLGQMIETSCGKIVESNEFAYEDPVDGSKATKQGLRFTLEDGSRLVFRLSGTGSSGATIRLYLEKYVDQSKEDELFKSTADAMAPLVAAALKLSEIPQLTGRSEPTVIT